MTLKIAPKYYAKQTFFQNNLHFTKIVQFLLKITVVDCYRSNCLRAIFECVIDYFITGSQTQAVKTA